MERGVNVSIPNERLEAARIQKRWSVALASEKAGVSVNTFNRWERGLQKPQLGTLDQLCKAFALSPEELGFRSVVTTKRQRPLLASPPTHLSLPLTKHIASSVVVATSSINTGNSMSVGPDFPSQSLFSFSDNPFEQTKRSLADMQQSWHKNDSEETVDLSRRHALAALLCAPAAIVGVAHNTHSRVLHPNEVVSLCAAAIPLSWRLFFEGGMLEVGRLLPGYLAQLDDLVLHAPAHREQAAALASQGYQLASLLTLQHQNFGAALRHARQAFTYGKQTQNLHLLTSALIRQAQVYFYLQRPWQRLQAYEQALAHSKHVSPLLQGRVYIGLTETYSRLGYEQEALRFLALAHQVFPIHCEDDEGFAYTHFNRWSLTAFEGQAYLNLLQYRRAWELFERSDKTLPRTLVPNRVELAVRQADASSGLGDLEQACFYLETALHASLKVTNQLRYNEVSTIYENMCDTWKDEPRMQNFVAAFSQPLSVLATVAQ
ncbi:MAG: hypothetical protein NVS2B12_26720 [Ktedonobacteraceae bacterium]